MSAFSSYSRPLLSHAPLPFFPSSDSMHQVTKKNLKLQIERAKKCTLLYVAAGSCSMLRFGNSKFSAEKNAENLSCAIEQMIKALPGKHKNIQVRRSCHPLRTRT